MKKLFLLAAWALSLAACSAPTSSEVTGHAENLEEQLLADYLGRINSNDHETLMAGLTDDIVYQAPHGPEVAGKDAVREWVKGYYDAFETQWEKTSLDFIQSGDWAFERYAYNATDTDRATGAVYRDEGKGINIYHKGGDGQWRVARDTWSTNLPAAAPGEEAKAVVETVYAGFAVGDMEMVTGVMVPDIVWNEAEGNPYADKNPYIGPEAILTGLFARLGGDWDGFTATPETYVAEGGRVIVTGRYAGSYKATGKAMDAPFVHVWTVEDGEIVAFQQYTDTAAHLAAMTD